MPLPPSTPQRRKGIYLNRDQRLQARTLRQVGQSYRQISDFLNCTERQVQHACTSKDGPTPKRRSGRTSRITPEMTQELIEYVCQSRETRQMSYLALATGPFLHWNVGQEAIRYTLKKEGFVRAIARAKPPLSETNRLNRLAWAEQHKDWS